MENQNNRKEALRKRIEDVLKNRKPDLSELGSKTLEEILQEVSIYHQELEYQNLELQRVYGELEKTQSHYVELFQDAPMGYVVVDEENKILSANKMFARYFEGEIVDVKGKSITTLIHPDFQDQFYLLVKKVHKEKAKSSVLVRLNCKKETFVKLECNIQKENGKVYYRMGFLDVTREVINEEQLIESRERFRAVADYAYHWEYWQDQQGRLLYMSPSCERITGYSKYEFFDNPKLLEDIIHPDDKHHFDEHKSVALIPGETRVEHIAEYRITRKDGGIRWIGHACQSIFKEDGTHIGQRATNRDITERKKIREKLAENLNLLSKTQEIAHIGSWELDMENDKLYWSDEIYRIFGLEPQQPKGSYEYFLEIVHPDDREAVHTTYVNSLRDDANVYEIEHRIVRQDNKEVRYVYEKCYHERDNNGRVIRSVGMVQDVTERKHREQKLVMSDRIFNHALDMLCIAGFDGYFKILNPSWSKVLGYTTEELMAKPWLEYVHPDDREATKNIKASIVNGQEIYQFENRYICKDGTIKWLSWNSFPYPKENIMYGVARDITFKKQAEERLKSSELKLKEQVEEYTALNEELNQANDELRNVMEDLNESNLRTKAILSAIPDMMFVLNREGVYIDYYSPNDSLLAANPSEFLGKPASDILPQEVAEINKWALEQLFETGDYQCYSYSLQENNDTKYFDARLVKFGVDKALAIVRDITEQKKGQLTIAKNEQYLNTILQTTADGFWITDLEGNLLEVNEAYCQMSGYSLTELLNLRIAQIDVTESPEDIRKHIDRIAEEGSDIFETKHRRKDGTLFDVEVSVSYLDADGGQLICFTRDISERKYAQEKLRESEERFKLSMEATNDGLWDWDVKAKTNYYSPAYYTMLGYEVGGFSTSSSEWEGLVHPDDLDGVRAEHAKCVNGITDTFDIEFRMKSFSGEWKWIYSRGKVVERDDTGIALRLVGTHVDITERKQFEETLKQRNHFIQTVLDNLPIGVALNNIDEGQATYINKKFQEIYGWSEEALKNISQFFERIYPDKTYREELMGRIMADIQSGDPERMRWENIKVTQENGSVRIVNAVNIPLFEQNTMVSTVMDVTEQKAFENALKESETRFKALHNASFGGITIHDKGLILDCNQGLSEITGYSQDELIGMNGLLLIAEETRDMVLDNILAGYEKPYEAIGVRKDGSKYPVRLEARNIPYKGKQVRVVEFRDITEQKLAEEKLAHSHYLMRYIIEHNRGAVAVHDRDMNYVYVSKRYIDDFGVKEKDIIGKNHYEVFPDLPQKLRDAHQLALRGEVVRKDDDPFEMPNGSMEWTRWECRPWYEANGSIGGVIVYTELITERKQAELALRESEEKYRMLFEANRDGIAIFRFQPDGGATTFIEANPSAAKMLGYTYEEFLQITVNDLEVEVGKSIMERRMRDLKSTGLAEFETTLRHKNGHFIYANVKAIVINYLGGPAVLNITRDITDRKQAELAIKAKTAELEAIYNNSPLMMCILDEHQNVVYANNYLVEFFGKPYDEIINGRACGVFGCINASEHKLGCGYGSKCPSCDLNNAIAQTIKTGESLRDVEYNAVVDTRGKKDISLMAYTSLIKTQKKLVSLIFVDVSERKQMEDALRESEERFRGLYENATVGIYRTTPDGKVLLANPALVRMLEYSSFEELTRRNLNKKDYETGYERTQFMRLIEERGEVKGLQSGWRTKSGKVINISESARAVYDNKGNVLYYEGIVEDITERTKAVDALRASQERISSIFRVAPIGIGVVVNRVLTEVNQTICDITGYAKEDLLGQGAQILYPTKEEFEYVGKEKYRQIAEKGTGSVETAWQRKDGAIINVLLSSTPIVKGDLSQGVTFTALDITQRKQTERLMKGRLKLLEFADTHSLPELLKETLAVAEDLTGSQIGFYHFIDEEKGVIKLNQWSERTEKEFCKVTSEFDMHYPIDKAGVWVECIKKRKPIIHNDYQTLAHRKELPKGHALVSRELTVPVIRNRRIVAVLGIGNKTTHYTKNDIDIITQLADMAWDIAERKMAEEQVLKLSKGIEQSPATVVITDIDGNIEFVNPRYTEVTGYTAKEVMGKNPRVLKSDYHSQEFYKELWDTIKSGNDWKGEFCNRKKTGEHYWASASISPIKNERGEIVNFIAVKEDITDRKNAILALEQNNRLINTMLDNLPIGIFMVDALNGKPIIANEHAKKLLGRGIVDDASTETLSEVYMAYKAGSANLYPTEEMPIVRGINGQASYVDDMEVLQPDGSRVLLEVYGCPVYNSNGEVWASLVGFTDITERKKAEEALRESELTLKEKNEEYLALNEELTESNERIAKINKELVDVTKKAVESDKLKSAFLANMSHEIRTPMNAIIGFSEMLLNPKLPTERKDFFAHILNSACHQLLSVVEDVIDISKIETGQMEVHLGKASINKAIYRIRDIFEPQAQANGVQILVSCHLPNNRDEVLTDSSKLNQVLTNLLNNALKFTESGTVDIGYTLADSMLKFYVKDTGVGIDPSNHELIFERFRQVDMGSTRNYGGTGLGLPICKAFIEMLGGTIWVESELGKGAKFYFTIPYEPVITPEVTQGKMVESDSFCFADKTILIAEDEEANYLYISELLEDSGATLIRAFDGQAAVDIVQSNSDIDLILMDIKMPVMTGVEATRVIREMNVSIPIIALTAYAMTGDRENCLAAGCNAYISKPVRRVELLKAIAEYLTKP
ncbi:PAS domain S-box protein [Perlabentimonas gracilis]|uniref:PAS domain S-box protein n=1 Tax=Perlabentimonas gracilis TaxID=2715279 RepID=UPI00140A155B|nr:PAS domain S-box protein [Perlabentimonas gracilis]NHB69074.1 PAS domain S-box protein [Perlabentimonas gracilis]